MDSSFASPQSSLNASISGNSTASSAGKRSKSFSNSIAKVFRKSSSSQDDITDPLLDEEVDSQLQVELKSLMLAHENLGQQASSLGAELAQTRAEAEALKSQLEDATSRLTPSPSPTRSKATFSPSTTPTSGVNNNINANNTLGARSATNTNLLGEAAATAAVSPSPSPLLGSPFGEVVHEDILALQAQIDLLTADIQNKNDAIKAMESARAADALTAQCESDRLRILVTKTKKEAEMAEAEAKHCIKQVQSGKEAALVAAATAASDARILASRCAALEVTVQRLMEGLENKEKVKSDMEYAMKSMKLSRDIDPNVLYSVEKPSATTLRLAAENSAAAFNESSQLSQASDCEAKLMSNERAIEGMDTASSGVTGPVAFTGEHGQEESMNFVGTIPAVHGINTTPSDSVVEKSPQMSVVGTGRFSSSGNNNNNSATASDMNKAKLFVINASSGVVDKKNKNKKNMGSSTAQENETKNAVVNMLIKSAAGVIVLAAVTSFVRGSRGKKSASKAHRSQTGAGVGAGVTGAASFVEV